MESAWESIEGILHIGNSVVITENFLHTCIIHHHTHAVRVLIIWSIYTCQAKLRINYIS